MICFLIAPPHCTLLRHVTSNVAKPHDSPAHLRLGEAFRTNLLPFLRLCPCRLHVCRLEMAGVPLTQDRPMRPRIVHRVVVRWKTKRSKDSDSEDDSVPFKIRCWTRRARKIHPGDIRRRAIRFVGEEVVSCLFPIPEQKLYNAVGSLNRRLSIYRKTVLTLLAKVTDKSMLARWRWVREVGSTNKVQAADRHPADSFQ
jgi:hypothetical protein